MNADQLLQAKSISNAVTVLGQDEAFHTPRISKRLAELVMVDKRIWELCQEQGLSSYTRGTTTLAQMRLALRKDHLNPISRDGKLFLAGEPGIRDSLRLPHARVSDKALVEAARRITDNVRRFKVTFIDEGYHPDFLERAVQAIDQFERISSQPAGEAVKRSFATRELPKEIRRGRLIMAAIDSLVQTDLADEPILCKVWKSTYRVPKKIGRPSRKRSRRPKHPPA